ncbi:hypothetical protein RRG08_057361 [Elysia crispata]|uniref:Uncharacterized protein n=1 Tax=Elysia crispata TaxID=231223 RepID=A0AAE0YJG1_9GAST|nr:hypothetical protein RRG08_057361 [Elysia crispata]
MKHLRRNTPGGSAKADGCPSVVEVLEVLSNCHLDNTPQTPGHGFASRYAEQGKDPSEGPPGRGEVGMACAFLFQGEILSRPLRKRFCGNFNFLFANMPKPLPMVPCPPPPARPGVLR